jgi:hypothetical protein
MGLHIEGIENVYIFIFIIIIGQTWKYVEKNHLDSYTCPTYCAVDHDHDMEISGHISDTRALRDSCSSNDSLWVFHMETESVDSE